MMAQHYNINQDCFLSSIALENVKSALLTFVYSVWFKVSILIYTNSRPIENTPQPFIMQDVLLYIIMLSLLYSTVWQPLDNDKDKYLHVALLINTITYIRSISVTIQHVYHTRSIIFCIRFSYTQYKVSRDLCKNAHFYQMHVPHLMTCAIYSSCAQYDTVC